MLFFFPFFRFVTVFVLSVDCCSLIFSYMLGLASILQNLILLLANISPCNYCFKHLFNTIYKNATYLSRSSKNFSADDRSDRCLNIISNQNLETFRLFPLSLQLDETVVRVLTSIGLFKLQN